MSASKEPVKIWGLDENNRAVELTDNMDNRDNRALRVWQCERWQRATCSFSDHLQPFLEIRMCDNIPPSFSGHLKRKSCRFAL